MTRNITGRVPIYGVHHKAKVNNRNIVLLSFLCFTYYPFWPWIAFFFWRSELKLHFWKNPWIFSFPVLHGLTLIFHWPELLQWCTKRHLFGSSTFYIKFYSYIFLPLAPLCNSNSIPLRNKISFWAPFSPYLYSTRGPQNDQRLASLFNSFST